MNPAWHARAQRGVESPAPSWRPPSPVRAASTSVLGGGIGSRAWFVDDSAPAGCAADDPAEPRGGPGSRWGAPLARAVLRGAR